MACYVFDTNKLMAFQDVEHVAITCKFHDMHEHTNFTIHNVVITMMLCSHDGMQDLTCGLFYMMLRL